MRHLLPASAIAMALFAAPVAAQQVVPCDGLIDITMISEPWDNYSRSYAEGAIRLFEAYVAPTMAAGAVIGVLHPVPGDPYPYRACSAVVYDGAAGPYFAEALISDATAGYDPSRGLTVRVPVRFPDNRQPIPSVEITINQATGVVSVK